MFFHPAGKANAVFYAAKHSSGGIQQCIRVAAIFFIMDSTCWCGTLGYYGQLIQLVIHLCEFSLISFPSQLWLFGQCITLRKQLLWMASCCIPCPIQYFASPWLIATPMPPTRFHAVKLFLFLSFVLSLELFILEEVEPSTYSLTR